MLALRAKQQKAKAAAAAAVIPRQPRQEGVNRFPLAYPQQRIMF